MEFFEKAIVEDAQYAQAYSGLADAYSLLGHYGVVSPAEVSAKAASHASWAVLQDDRCADAHTSLAHIKATQDWDWLGAEGEFQRANRAELEISDRIRVGRQFAWPELALICDDPRMKALRKKVGLPD